MCAGMANSFFMRMKELDGVNVYLRDQNNELKQIGISKIAGREELKSLVLSRSLLSIVCVGLPVVLSAIMSLLPIYARAK